MQQDRNLENMLKDKAFYHLQDNLVVNMVTN